MPVLNPSALITNRIQAIADYHAATGLPGAQIDVSGGIDSAVLVGLLAHAVGPARITAVHSQIHSDPDALARAREVCATFGVPLIELDLSSHYDALVTSMIEATAAAGLPDPRARIEADPTVLGSIRSTLRAPVGRGLNRMTQGGVRHGTGNECEDRWARFFQKGGDGEVDTNPIAMLSKAEVVQLAIALGVPDSIVQATPTPDLWGVGDEHNDEAEYAQVFDVDPGDETFYGRVAQDGSYVRAGLIERVSRCDDDVGWFEHGDLDAALAHTAWKDVEPELARTMLLAARRTERSTRHKWNPNCPTLGERQPLVDDGILSDHI